MAYITPSSMLAMAVCFLNIPTLLLMLRFVVRRLQKISLGIDDWLIIPAWFFLMATCMDVITGVAYGRLGKSNGDWDLNWDGSIDLDDPQNARLAQMEQFVWVTQILLPVVLALSKLSVLFFYRRMLCPENLGPFHKFTKVLVYVVAAWGLVFTFLEIFQCGVQFEQIFGAGSEQCLSSNLDASFTWTDAILDIIILVIPIRKIMSLRLPLGKKIAAIGAFGVGGLTTVISIVRCAITVIIIMNIQTDFYDETLAYSIVVYWSLFEAGTSVIVACLPSLQYLFRRFLPEQVRKSRATGEGSGTKSFDSRPKSIDVLEKASVMTQSTMASRPASMASHLPLPIFNSRPGTPALEHPPPMPETPASRFMGFRSRTDTLVSDRPSMSSGTATPVSAIPMSGFHKRVPSDYKEWDGGFSPVSRTSTMDSRTPLFDPRKKLGL